MSHMCPNCDTFVSQKGGVTQMNQTELPLIKTISIFAVSCRKLEKIAFAAHGEDVCFSPRKQMVTKGKMVHQGGREGGL